MNPRISRFPPHVFEEVRKTSGDFEYWAARACKNDSVFFFNLRGLQFIGFGENNGEGTLDLAEPFQKLEIDFLRLVARINQHKHATEIGTVGNVTGNDFLEGCTMAFRHFGVAIAWKVDHAKGSVDFKKINELGAPGSL
jgi:hypothetical protein